MIVLVRDPRDTIVSAYYERTERGRIWNYTYHTDPTLSPADNRSRFIRERIGSVQTLLSHLSASAHLLNRFWSESRRAVLGTFESLFAGGERGACALQLILTELMRSRPAQEFVTAIRDRCTFDQMQREADESESIALAPADPKRLVQSRKVRRGVAGAFKTELRQTDISYLESAMRDSLPAMFGYRPARPQSPPSAITTNQS